MKSVGLSILVISCKDYKPTHDWYYRKSESYIVGTARTPDIPGYDEERRNEFNASDDYVLMPECPRMTDDEAINVVKAWCGQNDIRYVDDLENIKAIRRWYYRLDD